MAGFQSGSPGLFLFGSFFLACFFLVGGSLFFLAFVLFLAFGRGFLALAGTSPMISVTGAATSSSITIAFGTCTDTIVGFSFLSRAITSTPLQRHLVKAHRMVQFQLLEVDHDEFGQIVRQTLDIDLVHHVVDHAAAVLTPGQISR